MSSKIESHAQALLSSLDVFLVERIAFFDCAEAGILTDRPRSLCVHGRVRSTSVRKLARNFILKTLDVLCSVKRLDIQSLVKKNNFFYRSIIATRRQLDTSCVCHVSFSEGSAPFNCFLAIFSHSGCNEVTRLMLRVNCSNWEQKSIG